MKEVIFNSGVIGFIIWVLLFAASTVALAIAIKCVIILRKGLFSPKDFIENMRATLKVGDWQGAIDYCQNNSSLVTKIIEEVLYIAHEKDVAERQELASSLIDRRVKLVLRQVNALSMCGNIAPMLGLLGTVTGMVDAFMGLGSAMGPEKASVLAIAISQALYTTAAGLLVSIPAICCTVIFRNILEKRIEDVGDLLDKAMSYIPDVEKEQVQQTPPQAYCSTKTVILMPT